MTDIQAGDIVDVTITGAKVEAVHADGWVRLHTGNDSICLDYPSSAVTVTRRTPQPQADLAAAYAVMTADRDALLAEVARLTWDCATAEIAIRDWQREALDARAQVADLEAELAKARTK